MPQHEMDALRHITTSGSAMTWLPHEALLVENLHKSLHALCSVIAAMKSLESFSFSMSDDDNNAANIVGRSDIAAILEALPGSVCHLEVAFSLPEILVRDDSGFHLCPLIRKLLGQLRNVRLRASNVCSELLQHGPGITGDDAGSQHDSKALKRTMLINTILPNLQSGFQSCKDDNSTARSQSSVVPQNSLTEFRLALKDFGSALQWDVSHLDVHMPPAPLRGSGYHFSTLCQSTFGSVEMVTKQPVVYFPGCGAFLRQRLVDGKQYDVWGSVAAVVALAERQEWVETEEGYRMPRKLFERKTRFESSALKELALIEEEKVQECRYGSLFEQEKTRGCELLISESAELDAVDHATIAGHRASEVPGNGDSEWLDIGLTCWDNGMGD